MTYILSHWPLTFICLAMIVAAVIDGWKLKVPNWLTFPLVISGWLLGLVHSCEGWFDIDLLPPSAGIGGIGAALAGTAVGFALLLPVYSIGGMGAGDVKMQMGFGSWVGAFYGFTNNALSTIWWAFAVAVIIGGVMAAVMILVRGEYRQNLANTKEIVGDLLKAGSVTQVAENAAQRKPRMRLLPYGIPLCLGFVGYLIAQHGF
jgi:prepilin peptidase CpaA